MKTMVISKNEKYSIELDKYLSNKRVVVDNKLEYYLNKYAFPGRLSDAMRYAVMAGGKRLRPVLCLAAAEAVSGEAKNTLLVAGCAIEFIHTYSLIHDDLPAMDDDVLRRGNATCHVKFDEATAILAGDALLTLAFEILSEDMEFGTGNHSEILRAIMIISKAAGARGMVEGQMQDMLSEGRAISLEMLERLHALKTGALISASVETGALLAGANQAHYQNLTEYARHLGMLFQVTDDLLNVEGDPAVMGKSVGTDAEKMKSTYPSLLGMAASKKKARELADSALQALEIFDTKADPLRAIAMYVIQRDR
jgi:geranylgeranyl diphosphate synthase type II